MDIVAQLLNYAPHILGAVVVLFLWRRYGSGINLSGGSGLDSVLARFRGPDHAAQQERRAGNHLVAGRLYEELEMFDEAIATYLEGGEQWSAASVHEKQRRFEKAAQLYQESGDLKKAAEVWELAGKPARAGALLLEDGNNLEAARCYGEAGEWVRAAELFSKAGFPQRAGAAYEKTGDVLKAAECYESYFMENVAYATSGYSTSGAPGKELKTALKAGQLFEQADKPLRAREMYARGNFFPEAARVSLELGEFVRAAEQFQRAEDPAAAADAYDQAGDAVKAALLRGEVAFKANEMERAAGLFQQGQDYLRAAELFETMELWDRAASAYVDGASFSAAAGVYLRAGMKAEAAAAFEQGGSWEEAAKLFEEAGQGARAVALYEKAGLTFQSGVAAAEAGDVQEAIRLLQRVPASDESYAPATERLAQLFVESDMPGLAIERLEKVLDSQPVQRSNLPLYYWLARAHEAKSPAAAATLYKKVLAEDVGYHDARERAGRLGTISAPSAAAAAGLASPAGSAGLAPPAAPHRAGPGERIGKYRVERLLGQGSMGRVYVARDTVLERDVALKLMATPDDAELKQRFEREARAIARMTHPNVVTVFDLGHAEDGSVFIAMELLHGQDLQRALRSAPGLRALERRLAVLLQVLAGLDHAHRAGIVHRDVKPANVFIGSDGSVRLMDFGVARFSTASMTGTGSVVGTADYMSPEQVKGAGVEGPSDLFSVGVMLFELLTGKRPFHAESLMATFYAITHKEPDWSALPPGAVNIGLDRIAKRALAKDVANRYSSASELAQELREVLRRRSEASGRSLEQLLDLSGTLGGGAPTQREAAAAASGALATRPPAAGPPTVRSGAATGPPRPAAVPAGSGTAPPRVATRPPSVAGGATGPPGAGRPRADRFQKQGELGRGPLGTVFRAVDSNSGRQLALRVLPPRTAAAEPALATLLEDLRAAGRLTHPGLVRVLGMVEVEGRAQVISELIEGYDLGAALAAGPMLGPRVQSLGRVLAGALAHVHERGLVHGSVRPSNVMMAGGAVRLADLGLGALYQAIGPGSPYRPPEPGLSPAGDIYSLGAVLHHALTGAAPEGPEVAPGPGELGARIAACLDPKPERRPTAAQLEAQFPAPASSPA